MFKIKYNPNFLYLSVIILFITFETISLKAQEQNPGQRAYAIYTAVPPKIDGRVDKAWLEAPAQKGFLQHSPDQGDRATNDTRFYVLYDHENIYLLFIMLDKDIKSIPARLLERDQEFYPDDSINFLLDTFNDNRKAFYFSTNPSGVEHDGLISENGDKLDLAWDGIYNVAACKNGFGWIAEFAVPFKTIRFDDDLRHQVWGFNVWRVRKKSREISFWSLVDQNYRLYRLDKSGVLTGVKDVQSGRNLGVLPYTTAKQITAGAGNEEYETLDFYFNVNFF